MCLHICNHIQSYVIICYHAITYDYRPIIDYYTRIHIMYVLNSYPNEIQSELKAIFKNFVDTKEELFREMYRELGSKYLSHPLKKAVDKLHETKYTISQLRSLPNPIGLTSSEAIVWAELKKYDMIKQLNDMSPEVLVAHHVRLSVTDW